MGKSKGVAVTTGGKASPLQWTTDANGRPVSVRATPSRAERIRESLADPTISDERRAQLTDWLESVEDQR
jgi:hypothetical protein